MKTGCNAVTDVTGGSSDAPRVAGPVGPRRTLPFRPEHTRSGEQVEQPPAAVARYEPTENEQASLRKFQARRAARAPSPTLKVKKNGKALASLQWEHADPATAQSLLLEAFGTAETDFLDGLLDQLANASAQKGEVSERGLTFMLAFVKSLNPRNEVEAMLGAQMAAVHMQCMTFARRLAHVETIPQDSAVRALNALTRTFATQMAGRRRT
jgi:hypothetical protein